MKTSIMAELDADRARMAHYQKLEPRVKSSKDSCGLFSRSTGSGTPVQSGVLGGCCGRGDEKARRR